MWEFIGWVITALLVIVAGAAWSVRRTQRRLQQAAVEVEGEWLEEEVRRSSLLPPPTSSLNPLELDVMHAQIELNRRQAVLRHHSSVPPVPGKGFVPPPGYIPPPPPSIMEAANLPFRPAIPPPPLELLKKK